jgi:hypothetical protein
MKETTRDCRLFRAEAALSTVGGCVVDFLVGRRTT